MTAACWRAVSSRSDGTRASTPAVVVANTAPPIDSAAPMPIAAPSAPTTIAPIDMPP